MVALSEVRAALKQYEYCLNGHHGPGDYWNYTTHDDWLKAEAMLKDIVGWQAGDSGPLPYSRSDFDERPYTERGRKLDRLLLIVQETMYGSVGEYGYYVDRDKTQK